MKIMHGVALLLWVAALQAEPLDQVVAVVNNAVITSTELNEHVSLLKKQLASKSVALPGENALKKQVLQHLIDINLQLQMAKQQGISIEDAELTAAIDRVAAQNQLALPQLKEALKQQGMTWGQYRENIRKEMLIARSQQQVVGQSIAVTPAQVEAYLKKSKTAHKADQLLYHVQNIVIPLPEAPTSEQLAQAHTKADALLARLQMGADFSQLALAESSGEFALEGGDLGERHLAELPLVFANQVIEMKVGEVKGPFRTGNGFQLLKLVGISGAETRHLVTKTHVRHILVKPGVSMTKEEVKAQLTHLYQQLHSGADFARLAKQYSLDPVSAVKGGDLGWVGQGELVPEFEKEMITLPLHQVSQAIKSRYGWHFIEVLGRKTVDDTKAFERQQVQQFLQQRKFTEAIQHWQQKLRAQAYVQVLDPSLSGAEAKAQG